MKLLLDQLHAVLQLRKNFGSDERFKAVSLFFFNCFQVRVVANRYFLVAATKFRRDLATLQTYEAISHNQTGIDNYSTTTPESTIFAANTSCILTPEDTDGPYYVTGEQIRKDVTEGQVGVPLYLEVQYLDITTCLPVPEIYVDIWNCNATGVYGYVTM